MAIEGTINRRIAKVKDTEIQSSDEESYGKKLEGIFGNQQYQKLSDTKVRKVTKTHYLK